MSKAKRLPSREHLNSLLDYDQNTGKLFWRLRVPESFASRKYSAERICSIWNAKWAGKEAFTFADVKGYLVGSIDGVIYKSHRVIWKIMTGEEPVEIDHQDGDTGNNRFPNLENGSKSSNQKNRRKDRRNKSGAVGVRWHKKDKCWTVYGGSNGLVVHLGNFTVFSTAVAVRKKWERENGFHPNHGR